MSNISKLFILVIAIFSLTAHSETIKEKADKGLFDRNLNITQTLTTLGTLADDKRSFGSRHKQKYQHRDNAIRVLLGNNATAKSYIKTPLSVNDALALLKGVRYRANLISHLTHNKQITTPFSVEQILQLINGVSNRGWMVEYLSNNNLLPSSLSSEQVRLLMGTQKDKWSTVALKALTGKELMQNDLALKDVLTILGDLSDYGTLGYQHHQHRDNAIRVLLGDNNTTKAYIKTPMSVADSLSLLQGVTNRDSLIVHLLSNNHIKTPLTVGHILKLFKGVSNRGWMVEYLSNNNLLPSSLSSEQVRLLMGTQKDKWSTVALKALTGKELMQNDLALKDVLTILGDLSDYGTLGYQHHQHRDNAIRVLLGDNNTTKAYIKTPMSVADSLSLLQGVTNRDSLIVHLLSNNHIKTPLTVGHILKLFKGVSNRGWMVEYLSNNNLLPSSLSSEQVRLLMGTQKDKWSTVALKALTGKELMQNDLALKDVLTILGDLSDYGTLGYQHHQHRDNAIRVLLGDNNTTKAYIKTPMSVADSLSLLQGVTNRDSLIVHLLSNNHIKTPLTVGHILKLFKGVSNRGWMVEYLSNNNLLPSSLSSEQVRLLMGTQKDKWSTVALKALTGKELMQNDLALKDVLTILGDLSDYGTLGYQHHQHRDNAIRVLLGDNNTTKAYIKTPMSVADSLSLLQGVTNRINLIQHLADYDLIQSGIREDLVINLTDSNDVKFTNQVIKILSGENLIKKNYFDQFVALSEEEIEKKVIKREFDTVIRILQSNENFVVYLLKHGYITTEMTIDQVNGLLLSQPTSHRLMTFTSIVNEGLLVANLNRSDVDNLIAAIGGNNCDADTQQSKELITNTVIRLLEGNNSSSKVFFKSQTKAEVAEQEKIKAEVIEIIKVIQQVHFVDFDIVFEGNHWKLKESAKRELNKLGAVLTSDVLVEGKFELVGHVSGKGGTGEVCIDSEHKYIKDNTQAKECFKSQNEWSTVLSDRRANTVKEYLIKNYSISTERLKSYGVGHSQHKFDDSDNPGNRRVEVRYIKK